METGDFHSQVAGRPQKYAMFWSYLPEVYLNWGDISYIYIPNFYGFASPFFQWIGIWWTRLEHATGCQFFFSVQKKENIKNALKKEIWSWNTVRLSYFWANYNSSLTWIKAIWGWYLILHGVFHQNVSSPWRNVSDVTWCDQQRFHKRAAANSSGQMYTVLYQLQSCQIQIYRFMIIYVSFRMIFM